MSKRKGELRQENPRDQLVTLIGSLRGETMELHDAMTFKEMDRIGRVRHRLSQLARAMETTIDHLDNTNWNPEKSKLFRLK